MTGRRSSSRPEPPSSLFSPWATSARRRRLAARADGRTGSIKALRHRAGTRAGTPCHHHAVLRPHAQLRLRTRRLHLGGERARAGRAPRRGAPGGRRWRRWPPCPSWTSCTSAATGATCRARPGRLDLAPVWAARSTPRGATACGVAFRVQLSNPEIQPERLALPDFLQAQVPLVPCGGAAGRPAQARRAPLRRSRVPARVRRAGGPAGRGDGRQGDRRVRGSHDVRLLGRGAHERLGEPVPRSRHRGAHVPRHDAPADGGLEARCPWP
jgi:hypothetical protein